VTEKDTILITGAGGMIGSQASFGIKTDRAELDILDPASIKRAFDHHMPRAVFHLAALPISECESNPEKARAINVVGTENVAKACRDANIRLIYLSTCSVFDGTKTEPYDESDTPNPVSVYGQTKLEAETIVRGIVPDSAIIRTGWTFGSRVGSGMKFVHLCLSKLQAGETVRATSDRYGSLTHVSDLLAAAEKIIRNTDCGIFHVVNSGVVSYYDIALEIKRLGAFSAHVESVTALSIEPGGPRRGAMEALVSEKIKLRSWQDALAGFIAAR
jgi:dTDP-4-dehydrorhamnose reductase